MVDINKYLENQLALAKQKQVLKSNETKDIVSHKSLAAAESISKKQSQSLTKQGVNKKAEEPCPKINVSTDSNSDKESEYVPSCDEDNDLILPIIPNRKGKLKKSFNKIIDDGDTRTYNQRVALWKKNLNKACSGEVDMDINSADIQYILMGHTDYEENHELQNGLCIPNYIWNQLYKYQRIGIKWLWELHQIKSGGLLGDEMGLGKTVQIIAFLVGLSKTSVGFWGGLGPTIIVAPATVIYQWVEHFHYWYPCLRVAVLHHTGSHAGTHHKLIRDIYDAHGILLITYAGIVKYVKDLLNRKWHYLILDEGHKIRNPETQVSKLVRKIVTPHRLIITGSPMQNSLQELWSLFDFMSPGLLGTHSAFMEYFALPITQGGYANATDLQETTALEIAKALKNIIAPYLLRRTKAEVQKHIKLPEKNEQVLFCSLSQEQRDLYIGYLMSVTVRSILDKENKYNDPLRAKILVALSTLRKICNHPDLYLYEAYDESNDVNANFGHWKRSGKMSVVYSLVKIWQKQGHRALIFTQSRAMLCLLEQYLQRQEYKYLKMDGTVGVAHRQNLIKEFNENNEYLVFLATTKVGGLGVNLTGADRVIIYDPDWNPAIDTQAKERAWRIGQQRNVTVYRLLSAGTIEEKIYQRQIFKQLLSNKILIDPNQKNILTTSTLQGLFTLEDPNDDGDTETASLFKHTKVNLKHGQTSADTQKDSGQVEVFTRKKLAAMRRMAKEISKKISCSNDATEPEDPRERYKKQRELLINPPKIEEPPVNLLDDEKTNIPFENIISEIDIINMHAKKNYEEKLINDVIQQTQVNEPDVECDDVMEEGELVDDEIPEVDTKVLSENEDCDQNVSHQKETKKRRRSPSFDHKIENLLTVKKIKKKKHKKGKQDEGDDDDYVLNKLFSKSGVKNALQHDEVVGLAEKEKKYRMREEAAKKAKHAIRAIKYSTK